MKRFLFTALAIVAIASCTKGLEQGIESDITGDVVPFAYDGDVRTNLVYRPATPEKPGGLDFTWSVNDKVAVFGPGGDQQVKMLINVKEGEAVRTATFTITKAYSLEEGSNYVAYCPMVNDLELTADAVDFSYPAVQEQETNAVTSTSHLGQYDFMVSDLTPAMAGNKAAFTFRHKCTPVYINLLNMPGGSYKSVSLVADSDVFTTKGTFDVFNNTSKSTELTNTLKINYRTAAVVAEKGTMHAWIMIAPVNLTGRSVKVVATTEGGDTVELNVEAKYLKKFVAGSAYIIKVDKSGEVEEVNLGLPSGTLWANMNLGAKTPYEKGDYYAWGETVTKEKGNKASYKFYIDGKATDPNTTKYNTRDRLTALELVDDAAYINCGDDWCIPTKEQWQELLDECICSYDKEVGVYVFTSKNNGNKMCLVANGYIGTNGLDGTITSAYYWSRNVGSSGTQVALNAFAMTCTYAQKVDADVTAKTRYYCFGIRPVKRKK